MFLNVLLFSRTGGGGLTEITSDFSPQMKLVLACRIASSWNPHAVSRDDGQHIHFMTAFAIQRSEYARACMHACMLAKEDLTARGCFSPWVIQKNFQFQ